MQRRYIVHDAVAHEVDEDTFYRTRESGGTRISSAYREAGKIIARELPARRVEHLLLPILRRRQLGRRQRRLPQVPHREPAAALQPVLLRAGRKPLRFGRLHPRAAKHSRTDWDNLILSEIESKDAIYDSIKEFLGTGR